MNVRRSTRKEFVSFRRKAKVHQSFPQKIVFLSEERERRLMKDAAQIVLLDQIVDLIVIRHIVESKLIF